MEGNGMRVESKSEEVLPSVHPSMHPSIRLSDLTCDTHFSERK